MTDQRPIWQRQGEDIDWPLIPWFVCAHAHIEMRPYSELRCADCGRLFPK